MIDRQRLLSDLQKLLGELESDLLERSDSNDVPEIGKNLRSEYDRARAANRTAQSYEEWKDDTATQMAAAWILSCVFVRFLEDNGLIDPPKIAGLSNRLQRARDEHELYFRDHPRETDREYLLSVFETLASLPGVKDVFGEHNTVRELPNWISGDAAGELLRFFQKIDANNGTLVHDFTDSAWDTRFLGDLYQDLSKAARKKYALLQTPEFVEEFILDRTLEPALDEFGLEAKAAQGADGTPVTSAGFRMIDPACGSGHFLLGSFRRILNRWQKQQPGAKVRDLVQRALDSVYGVDLNPYAIAIARFRLLLASMRACGIRVLADAPDFRFNLACGDSLLHGVLSQSFLGDWSPIAHHFRSEDIEILRRLLVPGQYHVAVANPPYITPKDPALSDAYRERYSTCYMKYSLAVPFMERLFQLTIADGFIGQITSNSFMKREFGKKLIEELLPRIDLTHVIDTSVAYIPGHGTPTVILFGRNRRPVAMTIRTVMGIRGEPSTPVDPAKGIVWSAIVGHLDRPGSQNEFVTTTDSPRHLFAKHPWSIGGGGTTELKEWIENASKNKLKDLCQSAGFMAITGEDDAFVMPLRVLNRNLLPHRSFVVGDMIRDWQLNPGEATMFPYDASSSRLESFVPDAVPNVINFFWPQRSILRKRSMFGKRVEEYGFRWYEYMQFIRERVNSPFLIGFAEVATHNHFVLDRSGRIFNQTAPVIKLCSGAMEEDHFALLAFLNSSTACFWMKQVCHQKQMMGGDGIRIQSKSKVPYAFNGTRIGRLPIPLSWDDTKFRERLASLGRLMTDFSSEYAGLTASALFEPDPASAAATRERWKQISERRHELRSLQILIQEEIDFTVYRMVNLADDDVLWPQMELSATISEGDRPFCIVEGTNEDGFAVPTSVAEDWPASLRTQWNKRIEAIKNNPDLRLLETSMYKRRWVGVQGLFNHLRSDNELNDAAQNWLANRLESYFDGDSVRGSQSTTRKLHADLMSLARLADIAKQDETFMRVGELYRDDAAFDVYSLIAELVEAESVPILPVLRYKESGLRKRREWERVWDLQREEDAIDARTTLPQIDEAYLTPDQARELKLRQIGEIPEPPKYKAVDFLKTQYSRLRGTLDVPKERWISFPQCDSQDGSPIIAWAGYDLLQLVRAISTYYVDVQERQGGRGDSRLVPLLACIIELLPWIKQWHNDPNPDFNGIRMGDYFEGFVQDEARQMGKTVENIKSWHPPQRSTRRTRTATI